MIRIICGTCGTSKGYKTAADGELALPAAEERRLVARSVAEYVTRPVMSPASDADSPVDGGDGGGAGINSPNEDPPVDGHFTRESLMLMRRSDMEKLAGDLGVDVSRCKNKGDIADQLVEVEVEAPVEVDGGAPPELGAEAPVL